MDGTESGDVGDDAMVDHFLAGRQTPLFIIVLSTFSTIFSGYTMVGVPNETNSKGFTSLRWVQAINSIIISMIIFVPRMRGLAEKRNYTSTVDFITDRYRSESLRLIMIAIMVISDIIYCIGQFAAISSLIETVTNGQIKGIYGSIFIGGLIFILECLGGLRSVMWTDAIQTAFMLISFLVVPFILNSDFGDFTILTEQQDCENAVVGSCGLNELGSPYTTYPEVSYGTNAVSFYLGCMMYFVLPQIIQRVYASSNQQNLKVTLGVLTLSPYLCMLPGIYIGIVCAARFSNEDGTAFGIISSYLYDRGGAEKFFGCLEICAGIAAISSTADSALIATSHLISEDIFKKKLCPTASANTTVLVSKCCSISVIVVSILLSRSIDIAAAISLQLAFQIQAIPAFLLGMHPELLPSGTPSSMSLVIGFCVSIIIFISIEEKLKNEGEQIFFSSGFWGLLGYILSIIITENTLDAKFLNDDQRDFDLPISAAVENFPRKEGDNMPPRLNDIELKRISFEQINEPFGSWTNKVIVLICVIFMIISLPWYNQPNTQVKFTDGLPEYANVILAFGILNSIALAVLIYRWKPAETVVMARNDGSKDNNIRMGVTTNNPLSSSKISSTFASGAANIELSG